MRELLADLMDCAAAKAMYADVRHVRIRRERVGLRNDELDEIDMHEEEGFGVRVLVNGAWGFAAVRGYERAAAEAALAEALAIARTQRGTASPRLAPAAQASGTYVSPVTIDPFEVSLEEKLDILGRTVNAMREEPRVTVAMAQIEAQREEKVFASTEGTICEQRLTDCGGGFRAMANGDGDRPQRRSCPASLSGNVAQAGWERVLALDLPSHAPRVAEEAARLVSAPACPAETTTLVLGGEQLALQLHESVAHAVELDRVLGDEASYAGTSWVSAADAGFLRYGSEAMSVTADATLDGGLGSFRWDDEGVEGQAIPIVREGLLQGFLSSRETAEEVGLQGSGGCMRAEGFARQPLVRMTNVNLDPGDAGTLQELISDVDRGIFIDTNRSWSIDSRREQFHFGGEAAWEIVDGELGRLLRDPVYYGRTPEFWSSLRAVCSPEEWRLISVLNCGKGEPGQEIRVSHGCAPARFEQVHVGTA